MHKKKGRRNLRYRKQFSNKETFFSTKEIVNWYLFKYAISSIKLFKNVFINFNDTKPAFYYTEW